MGISFYLLTFMAVYFLASIFIKIPGQTAGIIIIVISLGLSAYSLINSLYLDVKKIEIPLKALEKGYEGGSTFRHTHWFHKEF